MPRWPFDRIPEKRSRPEERQTPSSRQGSAEKRQVQGFGQNLPDQSGDQFRKAPTPSPRQSTSSLCGLSTLFPGGGFAPPARLPETPDIFVQGTSPSNSRSAQRG